MAIVSHEIDIWLRSHLIPVVLSRHILLDGTMSHVTEKSRRPARAFRSTCGGIIIMMMKSKNSRKNGNRALPPIMESDCEKWKIPQTPVVSRSRVHPSSRGPFKGVSTQTTRPTTTMTIPPQAVILSQPLLLQGTVATLGSRRCRRSRRIRDDTKSTSCASFARQFPSCSHVRPAFPSPRDTDRYETPVFN